MRKVLNGLLWTIIRNRKNICTPEIDRDHIRDQLAVAVAVHVHRQAAEARQQEHPEHDRAVETAPIRRDLEKQRLDRI